MERPRAANSRPSLDTKKFYQGTVPQVVSTDLMAQYENNCRQKDDLENLINQVHMKLLKAQNGYQARNCPTPHQSILQRSKSLDVPEKENTTPKANTASRRHSAKERVFPSSISLFPELSPRTLRLAQAEYQKRRPLNLSPQFGAIPKQASTIGPIRKPRSPLKLQEVNGDPSTHVDVSGPLMRANRMGSLRRIRSPVLNCLLKKEQEKAQVSDVTNQIKKL